MRIFKSYGDGYRPTFDRLSLLSHRKTAATAEVCEILVS